MSINAELYRKDILGGCNYILKQYLLSTLTTKYDDYNTQKTTLIDKYHVDSESWYEVRKQLTESDVTENLIKTGDLRFGMILLANYTSSENSTNALKEVFMQEDDELSLYEFLRKAEHNSSISKKKYIELTKALMKNRERRERREQLHTKAKTEEKKKSKNKTVDLPKPKDDKLNLTKREKNALNRSIHDMTKHSNFIIEACEQNTLIKNDAETYLDLLKYYFDNIARLFKMEKHLSAKLDESNEMLSKAGTEIKRLKSKKENSITADDISSAIERYESIFRTWYKSAGFRYAQLEFLPAGILASFSHEVNSKEDISVEDEIIDEAQRIVNAVKYEFNGDKYDLHDEYYKQLADTDQNRLNIKKLIKNTFPTAFVRKFESAAYVSKEPDEDPYYVLSFELYISFAQIEDWLNKIVNS